jgi:hypothetical protein
VAARDEPMPSSAASVSSARKTVSGFPAGSDLVLAKRSSGMTCPPLSTPAPSRERRAGLLAAVTCQMIVRVIRVLSVAILSRMSPD